MRALSRRPAAWLAILSWAISGCAAASADGDGHAATPAVAATCALAGPMACETAAGSLEPESMCAQLSRCLVEGASSQGGGLAAVDFCEVVRPARGTAAHAALVTAQVQPRDGPPSHAGYLFFEGPGGVEGPGGWCPAAVVLEPLWMHGGHCVVGLDLEETKGEISLRAERTCHEPLDSAEVEAGESDVVERECVVSSFSRGSDGPLAETARQVTEGPCAKRGTEAAEPGTH